MVAVIVHADDLGMSPVVNDAIFEAIEAGQVTSASLLANGPAVEDAARRCQGYPRCSFGVHLNLTEFEPLTRDPRLGFLLDEGGRFAGHRDRLCHWAIARDLGITEALIKEWLAQVRRLRQLGVPVSHLDSHNHAHLVVQMVGVLAEVRVLSGIGRMRPAMDLFDGTRYRADAWTRCKRRLQNALYRGLLRVVTPDHFTSLAAFLAPGAYQCVRPGETVEVMVHPGHPACTEESRLLETPWGAGLPWPVRKICYLDLPAGR